jgi:23S rRNA pseudouridine2605 synthase
VIHPRSNIEKEYLVKTVQEINAEHLKKISGGAFVEGFYARPISVKKVRRGTLKIIVKEGKKREVRVLVEKTGLKITSLTRIRIGALKLGSIVEGDYREMSESEKEAIFNK